MDPEALVLAHRSEWERLAALGRKRRLSGAECDELAELYQRTSTHLSMVRSTPADPALVQYLSTVLSRARVRTSRDFQLDAGSAARFLFETFPALCYRAWRWWAAVGVIFVMVCVALACWTATHPAFVGNAMSPAEVDKLVGHDFEHYYSEYAAQDFAFRVWTNNAWVSALCLAMGALGLPVIAALWGNALNTGVQAGLMASHGKLSLFFGLILPHGMLEMTCIFVAAGLGLRAFWSWIEPGPRSRADAFAQEMRTAFAAAIGLALVLAVCGVIEAFVTPSGLPTAARIGIGMTAWTGFIAYVVVFGRRAVAAGVDSDVDEHLRADVALTR